MWSINHDSFFECLCSLEWYTLAADNFSCKTATTYFVHVDVDECANDTDGCAQTCTNSEGSYTCSCVSGNTLSTDNLNCEGKK